MSAPLPDDALRAIAESALLSGAMDRADEQARAQRAADPEWAEPRWTHVHSIVIAFAVGVMSADPWHRNYRLPPQFEEVVACVAAGVQRRFKEEDVVQVSMIELEDLWADWASLHPAWKRWNESADGAMVGISHRYSPTPDARDFIDLGAALRNAALYLRDQRRDQDEFDRRFEAEWAANHAGDET